MADADEVARELDDLRGRVEALEATVAAIAHLVRLRPAPARLVPDARRWT